MYVPQYEITSTCFLLTTIHIYQYGDKSKFMFDIVVIWKWANVGFLSAIPGDTNKLFVASQYTTVHNRVTNLFDNINNYLLLICIYMSLICVIPQTLNCIILYSKISWENAEYSQLRGYAILLKKSAGI